MSWIDPAVPKDLRPARRAPTKHAWRWVVAGIALLAGTFAVESRLEAPDRQDLAQVGTSFSPVPARRVGALLVLAPLASAAASNFQ